MQEEEKKTVDIDTSGPEVDIQLPEEKTLVVRFAESGSDQYPIEAFDLTQFCTSREARSQPSLAGSSKHPVWVAAR